MAVKKHVAEQLDRLAAGRPSDQDYCLQFAKMPMARMVALKAATNVGGARFQVYVQIGSEWHHVPGAPVEGIRPSIVRGRSPEDQARFDARERERNARFEAEESAKRQRAQLKAQLRAVASELEQLRLTGGDRERLAELVEQQRDLNHRIQTTCGKWWTPDEFPVPGPGQAYPEVEVV